MNAPCGVRAGGEVGKNGAWRVEVGGKVGGGDPSHERAVPIKGVWLWVERW